MIFTILHREETSDIKERNKEKKINPFVIKKKKKKIRNFHRTTFLNTIQRFLSTLLLLPPPTPPRAASTPPPAAEKITQEFIRVGETQLFQSGRG